MAGLVILVNLLAAGAFAKRINHEQLHNQEVSNRPGLVPAPVQSFGVPPLAMMAASRVQVGASPRLNHPGGEGRLRVYRSPLMSQEGEKLSRRYFLGWILGVWASAPGGWIHESFFPGFALFMDGVNPLADREDARTIGQLEGTKTMVSMASSPSVDSQKASRPVDELPDLSRVGRMKYLPTPNEPTQTLQQRRRAAFDTFDKDQSGFIEGKDLTRALRLLGLKPDKFEDLEFSDGTGKVVDYKVLLLDYKTFIRIIAFNSCA